MPRTISDEAIVLRTFDVGDADRFCILLTKFHGKVAARAQGARKLLSRKGSGLLPFHRVSVVLDQGSTGYRIDSVKQLLGFHADPARFVCAAEGIELVLKLTEEGMPLPEVFSLVSNFLESPSSPALLPAFTFALLAELGLLPSLTRSCVSFASLEDEPTVFSHSRGGLCLLHEDPHGRPLSLECSAFLRECAKISFAQPPSLSASVQRELSWLISQLLGNQLGISLSAPPVGLAISSGLTPICQVNGLAS